MKAFIKNHSRKAVVCLFLSLGSIAHGHPGPPGHYHPDEVDEFDQVAMVAAETLENKRGYDYGGTIALTIIGGCLAFALCQKNGGIWRDTTLHH